MNPITSGKGEGGKHSLPTQAFPHPVNALTARLFAGAEAIARRLRLPREVARAATTRDTIHAQLFSSHATSSETAQPLDLPE